MDKEKNTSEFRKKDSGVFFMGFWNYALGFYGFHYD
jgi:hypothetical protein